MNTNIIHIGFWKQHIDDGVNLMPWEQKWNQMPIENSAMKDQTDLILKLEQIQKQYDMYPHKTSYFGASKCRLCGVSNGGDEYCVDNFVWPSGYIHYLKDHNVVCDEKFKIYL